MNKHALIFLLFLLTTAHLFARNSLSAASRVGLYKQLVAKNLASDEVAVKFVQAFVSIDDEAVIEEMKRQGITVNGVFDGFVVARVPVNALSDLISLGGVKSISLARPVHLCNDSARYFANVVPLQTATAQVVPLTGKGVIVGVIDVGIDFNHINFCDAEGRTRVRAVYMPEDSTGVAPVVQGNTLPGSCYETPEQIAMLTTDYTGSSHGTHTTGTAAGSCRENGWYGVATEADIVACGIPSEALTDANIANSVIYTFDYADRMGMPCVINMSIGSNEGPNDGTSFLCRLFDSLTGPGRLCVLSAGNDGNAPICLHASIESRGDTVVTLLRNAWGGLQRQGYVSTWSDGSQVHRSRLVIINRQTGVLEYASPFMDLLPEDSVYSISSEKNPDFATYYDGEVLYGAAIESDSYNSSRGGRFHSYWDFDATSKVAGHLLGLQYIADEPVNLVGWSTKNTYFYTFGLDGVTGGEYAGSISDMATTDSVISVGAYCSRASYIDKTGTTVNIANSYPEEIAYFSSWGPDERGVPRPDICAPGMAPTADRSQWPAPLVVGGEEYPYYSNQGTSMSAPIVTGTLALMLQVNADLGPSAVREVLRRSAVVDGFVLQGHPEQWGLGKLDATAAVDMVISGTLLPGDVNNDKEVNIADVMTLVDIILGSRVDYDAVTLIRADVNHDREIMVSDINCLIDLIKQ